MGISCVQCERKIGLFKRPVDGLYCSPMCRDAAEAAERENSARAIPDVEPLLDSAPLPSVASAPVSAVVPLGGTGHDSCPKCSASWAVQLGVGTMGRHAGACRRCGFSVEFFAIQACPNCRCSSLVVNDARDARCPRCKARPEYFDDVG
jgi:hypothetical protein